VKADLQARLPGAGLPEAVRKAAMRAGRRHRLADPVLLTRVRDALVRLPDSALHRGYFEIPGDSLASPRPRFTTPDLRHSPGEHPPATRETVP
jgi:hypothetical protein